MSEDTPINWEALTVVQLKEECLKRGLETLGRKADLVERLKNHEQKPEELEGEGEEGEEEGEGEEGDQEQAEDVEESNTAEPEQQFETIDEVAEEAEAQAEGEDVQQEEAEGTEQQFETVDEVADEEAATEQAGDAEMKDGEVAEGKSKPMDTDEAAETSKTEEKEKLNADPRFEDIQPSMRFFLSAKNNFQDKRTVLLGPMTFEDTQNPELLVWLNSSSQCNYYFFRQPDGTTKGWAKVLFSSLQVAAEAVENIKSNCNIGTSMKPKRPENIAPAKEQYWLTETVLGVKNEFRSSENAILIDNIPRSVTTDQEIAAFFPNAESVFLARTEADVEKHPGYGFALYHSNEDIKKEYERLKTEELKIGGNMLRVRMYCPDQWNPRPSKLYTTDDTSNIIIKDTITNKLTEHVLNLRAGPSQTLPSDTEVRKKYWKFASISFIYRTMKALYVMFSNKDQLYLALKTHLAREFKGEVCKVIKVQKLIQQHRKQLLTLYLKAETKGFQTQGGQKDNVLKHIRALEFALKLPKRDILWNSRSKREEPKEEGKSDKKTPQKPQDGPPAKKQKKDSPPPSEKKSSSASKPAPAKKPVKRLSGPGTNKGPARKFNSSPRQSQGQGRRGGFRRDNFGSSTQRNWRGDVSGRFSSSSRGSNMGGGFRGYSDSGLNRSYVGDSMRSNTGYGNTRMSDYGAGRMNYGGDASANMGNYAGNYRTDRFTDYDERIGGGYNTMQAQNMNRTDYMQMSNRNPQAMGNVRPGEDAAQAVGLLMGIKHALTELSGRTRTDETMGHGNMYNDRQQQQRYSNYNY